jgi:hypothetical protein
MMAADLEEALVKILESSLEDTRVPNAIAEHADKRAGKPVTTKDAEQLSALLGLPVRIRRQYGMTSVAWAVVGAVHPWSAERTILLAHGDTNIRWPSGVELRAKEPAYFAARDERNAKRRALLSEHAGARTSAVRKAAAAIAKLREARAELDALLDYEQPMYAVRYEVEKLVEKA